MEFAIVGAGAMGSLFGGLLGKQNDVTLLGRTAEHISSINANGLQIETMDGSVRTVDVDATTDPNEVTDIDLFVPFVKSSDTQAAMETVADISDDQPRVLTLQNGIGNIEVIAQYTSPENILAGTTAMGAIYEEPGKVRHTGAGDTYIGRYSGTNDEEVHNVSAALSEAGIETAVKRNIERTRWEKLLVNVGINAPTALARVRNGMLGETAVGRTLMSRAIDEANRVADAEGISVANDIHEQAIEVAHETASNHSSMRQDVVAGSRTEIDYINGAIVDRAEVHDIDVPVNRTLTELINLAEEGFTE